MCTYDTRACSNWGSRLGMLRAAEPAPWQRIDRELVAIARRRAELDAEEARTLREAERVRIWRHVGLASMLAYMESRLGYAPRTAYERLRVARALARLPALERALAEGTLAHSAVRELTGVVNPDTEAAWIESVRGKNLRQVEEQVRGRRPGALPGESADPDLRPRVLRFELSPATYALLRQAQAALADELGHHLDDDELVAELARRALEPAVEVAPTVARHQVAITLCERCERGWQDGGGAVIEIDRPAIETALCDAQHVGRLDDDRPRRAAQDVSPATRRLVWRRDHGTCQAPGCRSGRNLDVHHVVHRADGGGHEAANLTVLCSACHHALHRGLLTVTGHAPELVFERHSASSSDLACANPPGSGARTSASRRAEHSGGPLAKSARERDSETALLDDVRDALVGLGYRSHEARRAAEAAIAHVGKHAPLEVAIREALRLCAKPGGPAG